VNTPECDKALAVKDKSQLCGEFLEWLTSRHIFAKWVESKVRGQDPELVVAHLCIEDELAEFFGLDCEKMEQEKQAILVELRKGANHD